MYKRVLVPVDGSEVSVAVLPFLLGIAGPSISRSCSSA